jgi:hypothetical protein
MTPVKNTFKIQKKLRKKLILKISRWVKLFFIDIAPKIPIRVIKVYFTTSFFKKEGSFCELWSGDINGKEYSHSRVYKISGDQFYTLLSGQDDAMFQLYKAMPFAIEDYLKSAVKNEDISENSALEELKIDAKKSKRNILDQITFDNYSYYLGFDKL